jgi:hypothetical protein
LRVDRIDLFAQGSQFVCHVRHFVCGGRHRSV